MDTPFDPELDLRLERVVDVPPTILWRGWTEPDLLKQWFCPRPWKTTLVELDLRPGGRFRSVMEGPDGERHDETGCVLLVEPPHRFVFTDALGPDWRPTGKDFMTGIITLTPEGSGTRYVATARHATAEKRKTHAEMGFEAGWNTALDQLLELSATLGA